MPLIASTSNAVATACGSLMWESCCAELQPDIPREEVARAAGVMISRGCWPDVIEGRR